MSEDPHPSNSERGTLFVSADIEGVAGVVSIQQSLMDGAEWPAACGWMTQEVAAACSAAAECGFRDMIVADSHLSGQNLLIDALPANVRVVRSWPRPLGMMQGVDTPGVSAACLIGYHTGAHHAAGVLAHSFHGRMIQTLSINDRPASETTVSVALANHFGVPVVFATGDDRYVEYAERYPGVTGVAVKQALGRVSALTLTPAEAAARIASALRDRLAHSEPVDLPQVPFDPSGELSVTLELKQHVSAELLAYLPNVERTDAHAVTWRSTDIVALSRMLQFVTQYVPVP